MDLPAEGLPLIVARIQDDEETKRPVITAIGFYEGEYGVATFDPYQLMPYSPAASEEPANEA
jgi:hypothetical protein